MIFRLNPAAAKPVYQQLIDQVKLAIAAGRLRAGDQLPTVRDLAAQLSINRNTVSRVYLELEREGVLYTRVGHGTFISDQVSPYSRAEQRRHLSGLADDLIAQANLYGYSSEEVAEFFESRIQAVYPRTKPTEKSTKGGPS